MARFVNKVFVWFLLTSFGLNAHADQEARKKERERLIQKIAEASKGACERTGRPCKEFISPTSDSPVQLAYLESVVSKIVKEGLENFPDDLVPVGEQYLLIFSLEIARDGKIHKLALVSPSHIKKINEYAIDTINGAGPYPSFSGTFSEKIDIVVITKSITFSNPIEIEHEGKSN